MDFDIVVDWAPSKVGPELKEILQKRSYLTREPHEEPFLLSSGQKSWHYFDVERTTSYGPALPLIGEVFYNFLLRDVVAVGGPSRGADPIATAIAHYATRRVTHWKYRTFSVLKQPKMHGITGYLTGSVSPGDEVAIVDDVLTTGKSIIAAVQECWDHELSVAQVIVLVDREEGGIQRVRDYVGGHAPVEAIFTYSALVGPK